jgi:hypothetical protein
MLDLYINYIRCLLNIFKYVFWPISFYYDVNKDQEILRITDIRLVRVHTGLQIQKVRFENVIFKSTC